MRSDELLLDAGRILAGLPNPMTKDEVRAFAEKSVNAAATLTVSTDKRLLTLCGTIQPELTSRGALHHHIQIVAQSILFTVDAVDPALPLNRARDLLGSVWAGVLIVEN